MFAPEESLDIDALIIIPHTETMVVILVLL